MMRDSDFEAILKAKTAMKTHVYVQPVLAEEGEIPEDEMFDEIYSTQSMYPQKRPALDPEEDQEAKKEAAEGSASPFTAPPAAAAPPAAPPPVHSANQLDEPPPMPMPAPVASPRGSSSLFSPGEVSNSYRTSKPLSLPPIHAHRASAAGAGL